jgi:hypothetical protein
MKKQLLSTLLLTVIANGVYAQSLLRQSFGTGENAFTMEFVEIGNPGNPADRGGNPSPCGSVNYVYSIAKYEVSRDMINKANSEGGLGITMRNMEQLGGNGVNKPAVGICWNEAARFVNWLNSKEGFPPAYKFEKAPGEEGYSAEDNIVLWAPSDEGYDESNEYRNKLAKYFIPTNDEWYKAAFYNPEKSEYSVYPVKSDGKSPLVVEEAKKNEKNDLSHSGLEPRPIPSGKESDGIVYGQTDETGPADVNNAGGLSHYGTMAQGGNVCEWLETAQDGTNNDPKELRQPRGGCWNTTVKDAASLGSKVMYYNFGPSGWNGWPGGMRVVAKNPSAPETQGSKKGVSVIRRRVINIDLKPKEEKFGGHTYKFIPTKKSWGAANEEAAKMGAHLVTITSEAEQSFVSKMITVNGVVIPTWIGLTDAANEGSFEWVTGEALAYTNWEKGEPSNGDAYGKKQNYVWMGINNSSKWDNHWESPQLYSLVEIDNVKFVPNSK